MVWTVGKLSLNADTWVKFRATWTKNIETRFRLFHKRHSTSVP